MNMFYSAKWIFSICFIIILTGCKENKESENYIRNVILVQPQIISETKSTVYSGVVEEGASIGGAFMAEGKILKINVKEGDRVRKGQLLASLDDTDYKIGLSQLQAQYDQMTKEKERMDAMYEKHNIAPNDYEKFQAGYEQMKLQLDMMRRKLDYTNLYSPSDGYIATKYMTEGELVGAGTPVFNIIDDTSLMASVDLPVSVYLEKNNIVSAKGSVPGINGDIQLNEVSFTPDADNNMLYHLKLAIPKKAAAELTPGMNITVDLLFESDGNSSGMLIPSRSIFTNEGEYYVWAFNPEDSTISMKQIFLDGEPIGKNNIVKGLSGHEQIVETGVRQLQKC